MRNIEETRKRWDITFSDHETPSDLRAALQSERGDLCNDGLRSAFLIFDGLDRNEWAPKLDESRDAYRALRDHFLKYIEHPDDLESTVDPLADDEQSPWQTLRNDEALRAEILQDVDRCLQENFFFHEPDTKSKLTDVLFVYSKLNPDVGYRQGMHELLAPILWAVDRDSINTKSGEIDATQEHRDGLMLKLLDPRFVEHDSFTLFLSVMQTARTYYEHGETRSVNGQMDTIPIVERCQYLHKEALTIIDHELAEHLEAVEVLPQIFLTRWMRLLFGREFPFDDVLMMWDLLFAHGLRSDLVDFTCIAMLLRIRWQLLEADYTTALTLVLRYPSPEPHAPQTFVQDALYLEQNPTSDRGNFIISKYSGRPPDSKIRAQSGTRPTRRAFLWDDFKRRSESNSPSHISARNTPKSLESIFQDVSQGIQRRTESWGVAKAVRGAVTEARKNMQTMHYEPNMRYAPRPVSAEKAPEAKSKASTSLAATAGLEAKIDLLNERNNALASILREALDDLGTQLANVNGLGSDANSAVKDALAKAEGVQACLQDPSIETGTSGVPSGEESDKDTLSSPPDNAKSPTSKKGIDIPTTKSSLQTRHPDNTDWTEPTADSGTSKPVGIAPAGPMNAGKKSEAARASSRGAVRPSLTDSGFSWMLGGGRNLSGFVSSSPPPEQTRHLDQNRGKHSALFGSGGEVPGTDAEPGELALHSLRGSRDPLSGAGPL
ncbi:hypothetical protein N7452_004861 [Penicillium brevicompactum]|uniref:Rab-GAP TBC domain-containing protein n=1 Tax=Penicillium brevicompactum TaxID=5074 RepID=A0A9W9UEK1_PENBR|nr:hypothetical protein N7452_004861 [Penicillium brevicompactum]